MRRTPMLLLVAVLLFDGCGRPDDPTPPANAFGGVGPPQRRPAFAAPEPAAWLLGVMGSASIACFLRTARRRPI